MYYNITGPRIRWAANAPLNRNISASSNRSQTNQHFVNNWAVSITICGTAHWFHAVFLPHSGRETRSTTSPRSCRCAACRLRKKKKEKCPEFQWLSAERLWRRRGVSCDCITFKCVLCSSWFELFTVKLPQWASAETSYTWPRSPGLLLKDLFFFFFIRSCRDALTAKWHTHTHTHRSWDQLSESCEVTADENPRLLL